MTSANFFASKEKRHEVAEEAAKRPLHLNQRTPFAHLFFGPYVWFPVAAMGAWLGGLLALLGLWVHSGKPRYQSDEGMHMFLYLGELKLTARPLQLPLSSSLMLEVRLWRLFSVRYRANVISMTFCE